MVCTCDRLNRNKFNQQLTETRERERERESACVFGNSRCCLVNESQDIFKHLPSLTNTQELGREKETGTKTYIKRLLCKNIQRNTAPIFCSPFFHFRDNNKGKKRNLRKKKKSAKYIALASRKK